MRASKQIATVLFTDLVQSTDLFARLRPREAEEFRVRHFAALRDSLLVHQGREVKTLGDGIMAVFQSATDGVACAVTMQRGVARQNRRDPGRAAVMRVGLSVGETVHEQGDYFGASVIEASRLCATAAGDQILVSDLVRALAGEHGIHRLLTVGELPLKGLPAPVLAWQVDWDASDECALRVALAEDSVLLRQGVARVLEAEGIDVVLQAADAQSLLEGLVAARPHVVVTDVRMPPTHTTEGLQAAEHIRAGHPEIGVLVLSASVEPEAARRLLEGSTKGIGYLLKERVTDIDELASAVRTVASGGSAIDPEVIALMSEATTL